ncbi:hypothetical protein BASA81_005465 [Batrachochytrium salamandrivorans]|nr:hypothetical protein BASA81_005465 [Batrachochytrium salamandrivorans]
MFAKWSRQNLFAKETRASNIAPIYSGTTTTSSGEFSRCGKKHIQSEDRIYTRTGLVAEQGRGETSGSTEMVCIADMLKEIPRDQYDPDRVFLSVVTDGHGGSITSQFVSKNLLYCIAQQAEARKSPSLANLEAVIQDGFKACEDLLNLTHPEEHSGCCCLVSVVFESQVLVAHLGDVRAVVCENGEVRQLTRDHRATDAGEAARIIELGGQITNNRVHGVLAPSRAFGNHDLKSIPPANVLSSEPEVVRYQLDDAKIRKSPCFMIVATDGVWDCMTNEQACDLVGRTLKATGGSAPSAAKKLVEMASKKNDDDITVNVLVWGVEDEDESLEEADKL